MSRLAGSIVGSLQGKIVTIVLCAALVSILSVGVFADQLRRGMQQRIGDEHAAVAATYAGLVDEYLAGARSAAESLAKNPAVRAPTDMSAVNPELKGVPQEAEVERRAAILAVTSSFPRFRNIGNIAADGTLIAIEPFAVQKQAPANLGDRDFFQGATKTGEPFWSNVNTVPATGQPIVTIGVPVKDAAGKIQLVINGTLLLDRLAETASAVNVGADDAVMLFDKRGIPIVYPDAEAVKAVKPLTDLPFVTDALAGTRGPVAFYNPVTGRDELGAIAELKSTGWFVVVTQSKAAAFADFNRQMALLFGVLALGVLAVTVAGFFVARSISRNVKQVAVAAAALAEGDVEQQITVTSQDEVGQMAASFRGTVGYIREMATTAEAVANGDLTVQVTPRSDRDVLGSAVATMVASLREVVAQVADEAGQVADAGSQLRSVSAETSSAIESYCRRKC